MGVVLDTCILKLATLPRQDNPAALIVQLVIASLLDLWAAPSILEEYADVLSLHPEFLREMVEACHLCYPLIELRVIRHEPDNRFLECALSAEAHALVTVNTARGHFDQKRYGKTLVVGPTAFLNLPEVRPLVRTFLRSDL